MAQRLRTLVALGPSCCIGPSWWFTTTYNYNSRCSSAIFWPPRASGTNKHVIQITTRQNTHAHKLKRNLQRNLEINFIYGYDVFLIMFSVIPCYQAAAEKMAQAFLERNSELHALRQYLGRDLIPFRALLLDQQVEVTSISPDLGEQADQVRAVDSHRYPWRLHCLFTFEVAIANWDCSKSVLVIMVPVSF